MLSIFVEIRRVKAEVDLEEETKRRKNARKMTKKKFTQRKDQNQVGRERKRN